MEIDIGSEGGGLLDNRAGFLDNLLSLTMGAGVDILLRRGEAAVEKLDNATRQALLIPTNPPGPRGGRPL